MCKAWLSSVVQRDNINDLIWFDSPQNFKYRISHIQLSSGEPFIGYMKQCKNYELPYMLPLSNL